MNIEEHKYTWKRREKTTKTGERKTYVYYNAYIHNIYKYDPLG